MKNFKKVCLWLVALVLSVFTLVSCGEDETKTNGAEEAAKKVVLTQDKQEVTANFTIPVTVKGDDGVTYTVTWTSDNAIASIGDYTVDGQLSVTHKYVTIGYSTNYDAAVNVKLTAVIANADSSSTYTKEFKFIVPQFKSNTIAEYDAAPAGETLTVKGIIVAKEEYGESYKNTSVYIQDISGTGGYLAYRLACASVEAYNTDLAIGNTIFVTGEKDVYGGLREFAAGCSYIVVSTTPATPKVTDLTEMVKAGTAITEDYQAQLVKVSNLTVVEVQAADDKGRFNIVCGDENDSTKQIVVRINTYITPTTGDAYKAYVALGITKGAVISVKGVLGWYNAPQIHPFEVDAITLVSAGEVVEPEGPTEATIATVVSAGNLLEDGATAATEYKIEGTITEIDEEYSEQYKNVSFVISDGTSSILVFREKSDLSKYFSVGDKVSLVGKVKKYVSGEGEEKKTTIEFVNVVATNILMKVTVSEVLELAATLEGGAYLEGNYVVVGEVKTIDTAYSDQYKNVSFTLTDGTNDLSVFREKSDLSSTIAVGDQLFVTGRIQNYVKDDVSTIQITSGSVASKTDPTVVTGWDYYFNVALAGTSLGEMTGTVFAVGFKDNTDATKTNAYAMVVTADGPIYVYAKGFTKADWTAKFVVGKNVKLLEGKKDIYNGLNEYVVSDLSKVELLTDEAQTLEPVDVSALVAADGATSRELAALQGGFVTVTGKVVVDGTKYYIQSGENKIQIYVDNKFYSATLSNVLVANGNYTITGFLGWYNSAQITPFADGFAVANIGTSVVIESYAAANGWENSKQYLNVTIDEFTTVTASGTATGSYGTNTGKYYTNGQDWRIYQAESPELTITSTKTIEAVIVEYTINNSGILIQGETQVESGAEFEVNGTTVTFSVGNTSDKTNGQARITKITIIYAE